jgi:hypothetical protein
MAVTQNIPRVLDEVCEFLASAPSREQLVKFRFSEAVQQRARELLGKLKNGRLTDEEQKELDQIGSFEMLLGLVSARIRANRVPRT